MEETRIWLFKCIETKMFDVQKLSDQSRCFKVHLSPINYDAKHVYFTCFSHLSWDGIFFN